MGFLARLLGRPTTQPVHQLALPAPKADGEDGCLDPGYVDLHGYNLSREFVEQVYETNKLAARIVDTLPLDMTRLPLKIDAGLFDGQKISDKLDAQAGRMLAGNAMILARLYGGAALLAFVEDGRQPWEPVDFASITRIAGYAPLHRYELTVRTWDRRPDSRIAGVPNYGQPLTYNVHPIDGVDADMPGGGSVRGVWHRSRVIPWVNVPTLPRHRRRYYQGWSPGEIERIITQLLARAGGMEHVGNLLRSFGYDVVEIANLRGSLSTAEGATNVQNRLKNLSRSLQITSRGVRVVAVDAGNGPNTVKESLTPMTRQVAGVRDLSDAERDYLQEVSDYPRSVLYQWVNAGLGSGEALGEKQVYYDTVSARQTSWYIPPMRQMVELECAAWDGPTGGIIPPKLVITCPSLWSTPEDVAADNRLKNAQARKADVESGAVTTVEAHTDKDLASHYDLADPEDLTNEAVEEDAADIPPDIDREIDLQRQLKVGKGSFQRWINEGKIKSYQTGAGRRYSRREVIAAMLGAPKGDAADAEVPVLDSASPAMQAVIEVLQRAAPSEAAVLILGETGTGKELAARSVHTWSGRRGPFLAINCAVLDDDVPLSELLERLQLAAGGTAFLDELGELTPVCQAKLLRVLGGGGVRDVRWVAATNRDLPSWIGAGLFRADLYYRLAAVPVLLPPLRDRQEDLEPLAEQLLVSACEAMDRKPLKLDATARAALHVAPWPGNVRELKNAMERAAILAQPTATTISDRDLA